MASTYDRYTASYTEQKTVEIVTVDTDGRLVQGTDQNGNSTVVTIDTIKASFRWPVIGERWVVEKNRGGWELTGKLQDDADYAIEKSEPGDNVLGGRPVSGGVPLARVYTTLFEQGTYPVVSHNLNNRAVTLTATPPARSTTLTQDVGYDATTVTVDSTAGFVDSGVIYINFERLTYTGKTATQFTGITRGYEYDLWEIGTSVTQPVSPILVPYYIIDENSIEVTPSGPYPLALSVVG